jgi:hypothetical protein
MIDVAINVYGKPYQTIATLESLRRHSKIGQVFMTLEKEAPFDDDMTLLWDYIRKAGIRTNVPDEFIPYRRDAASRKDVRYQFGIDSSEEDYLFICHNDILFTGDIISDMEREIGNYKGIGLIGMCWNCAAYFEHRCDPTRMDDVHFTYDEAIALVLAHPSQRMPKASIQIPPMPMPECRLNEFACLVDRRFMVEKSNEGHFFGLYDGNDLGQAWFRAMVLQGYRFKHHHIYDKMIHGYWAGDCGNRSNDDKELYFKGERNAYEDTKTYL